MKKILILLLSVVPLLFTSCFGLWGPHEEDIMTLFIGNLHAEGEFIEHANITFEGKYEKELQKPYVYASWKNLDNLVINTLYADASEKYDYSFYSIVHILDNPEFKKDGQELLDNSVITFTYYPEVGEPVEVSLEGKKLTAVNKYTFYVTIDFDTKTFKINLNKLD